jgi:hypothetical protein
MLIVCPPIHFEETARWLRGLLRNNREALLDLAA